MSDRWTEMLVLSSTGAAAAALWIAVSRPDGWLARARRQYSAWVDREARELFLDWTPGRFALAHAGGAAGMATGAAALGDWPLAALAALIGALLGFRWFSRVRRSRRRRLEAQIDPMLRSMAQTLRVTANLADAIETVAQQLDAPIAQEMDLCLRQYRLGLSLEGALQQMSERTGSANVGMISTAILIARTTGGDLPRILDEAAAALRERVRLDGVIEARTAEGRAQAWVMGIVPPLMAAMLWHLDADMIRPLLTDPIGWAILAVVLALEGLGVWGVRRVTAIEV